MFKAKGKKASIRKKEKDETSKATGDTLASTAGNGAEEDELMPEGAPRQDATQKLGATLINKDKKKKKATKGQALLSFEEEEQVVFEVKKKPSSSKSVKLKTKQERAMASPPKPEVAAVFSSGSTYSADVLNELKKQTYAFSGKAIPAEGSKSPPESAAAEAPGEGTTASDSVSLRKSFGGFSLQADSEGLDTTAIPDMETIKEIKAKREERRKGQSTAAAGRSAEGHLAMTVMEEGESTSRLVREEQEEEEEAEVFDAHQRGRYAFGDPRETASTLIMEREKRAKLIEAQELEREASDVEEERMGSEGEGEDDEAEQEKEFEEEQLRRVMGRRTFQQQQEKEKQERAAKEQQWGPGDASAAIPQLPPVSLGDVHLRMQSLLKGRKEKVGMIEKQLEGTKRERDNLAAQAEELGKSVSASNEAYVFYQSMRSFMEALVDCFREKNSLLAETEVKLIGVDDETFGKQRERLREATEEDRDYVAGALDGAGFEVDEFGRDMAAIRRSRVIERLERRQKRVSMRKENVEPVHQDLDSGFSSDEDDLDEEMLQRRSEQREEVISSVSNLFDDVDDEYASINAIRKRFEEWKTKYPESYKDTFASESLPKLFSPFARLQLLQWDVAVSKDCSLEEYPFVKDLFDFGFDEETRTEDSDASTVPRMIEQVALPRLRDALKRRYNPFSRHRTKAAVEAVDSVMMFAPDFTDKGKQKLLDSITDILETALFSLPLSFADRINKSDEKKFALLLRNFNRGMKLLSNTFQWVPVLGIDTVEKIAIDIFLQRKIMPFLKEAPLHPTDFSLYEKVVRWLPESWRRSSQGVRLALGPFHEQFRKASEAVLQSAKSRGVAREVMIPVGQSIIRVFEGLDDANAAVAVARAVGIDNQ